MRNVINGYAKDKEGKVTLIGAIPVPHSKDKRSQANVGTNDIWSGKARRSLRRKLFVDMERVWRRVLEGKVRWLLCGLLLSASLAEAAEIDLSKGQLKHAGDVVTQVIAAKNNTEAAIAAYSSNAGSFTVISTGAAFNIEAGQTAYLEVIVDDASDADRTNCRVSGIDH